MGTNTSSAPPPTPLLLFQIPATTTQYNFVTEIALRRGHTSPTLPDTMMAAVVSGALISAVVTPMEGIKARLQVQYGGASGGGGVGGKGGGGFNYTGPVHCATEVYRTLGLRGGIYRGWLPVCFSRMSNYAYETPTLYTIQ